MMPPGMPMFNPMMMPPGSMPMPPPHFGQFMPGMPGMAPGFMMPPPPGAAQQVISSAPVMKAPTAPLPLAPPSSISQFNAASSIGSSVAAAAASQAANSTSNLLHKHIFQNAFAGLPVTLFIGRIPLDFEDAKLSRMLEVRLPSSLVLWLTSSIIVFFRLAAK